MSLRRRASGFVVVLCMGVCVGLVGQGSAYALETRLPVGSPIGPFGYPTGIAVNQSTGNVYVVDGGKNEVRVFGPEGEAPVGGGPSSFTGEGTPSGSFALTGSGNSKPEASGIATTGSDVYVPDVEHNLVDKFVLNGILQYEFLCEITGFGGIAGSACLGDGGSPKSHFSEPLGTAVDSSGYLYISDYGSRSIHEFNPAGEEIQAFSSPVYPQYLAVASDGTIYATEYQEGNSPKGALVEFKRSSPTGEVEGEPSQIAEGVEGVVFDNASGRLLARLGSIVEELDGSNKVVASFGLGMLGEGTRKSDIAVNEATGEVYVVSGSMVQRFGPIVVFPDVLTDTLAKNVTGTSATVEGSIDPDGLDARAYFVYGLSTSYGFASPLPPGVEVGSGGTECHPPGGAGCIPVTTTRTLTGLEPNSVYHYRLEGVNENGTIQGQDQTFATPAVRPAASVRPALFVGPHEAVLVGAVNPENSDSRYRFVFGTSTAYGGSVTGGEGDVGSNFAEDPVTSSVVGLQPGTTYHYAVVASNGQGSTQSVDMSFTTPAAPVPVVVTGAVEGVTQNSATIAGSVDPEGVSTGYEFDLGTDTSYGARVFGVAGSDSEPLALSLSVGGLQPDTTYHYRLVASNVYGTVYGADMTFTTPGFPSSLIAAPLAAPLVPVPAFSAPSTVGAVTVGAPKQKTKPKAKQKVRKKRRSGKRGRKASSAAVRRGERGRGEGGSGR
jgi:NHL repeat